MLILIEPNAIFSDMESQEAASYYVFIMTDDERQMLEPGVTVDLKTRLSRIKHNPGADAVRCRYLLYWEEYKTIADAVKRESELAFFSRRKLKRLISRQNPEWSFLNETVMNRSVSG